ncbi:MAG: DNA segregation ATPase FtsK/SpoIIIE, S-DNA-T family [Parcubacteria group bacterium Gr01-1014_73]|nr:MAG: DNA segregation ATPase FtsK/SpoIIIE, S-DNA-T family [Parcubacteria group bacterium Gr01-1014_73]
MDNIKKETTKSAFAVVFFAVAVFLILAAFGKAGIVGEKIFRGAQYLLGVGYFLFPILFFLLCFASIKSFRKKFPLAKIIAAFLFFLSALGLTDIIISAKAGLIGALISRGLIALFDSYFSAVFLATIVAISLLIIFEAELKLESLSFIGKIFRRKKPVPVYEDVEALAEKYTAQPETDEEETKEYQTEKVEQNTDKTEEFTISPQEWRVVAKPYTPPPLSILEHDKGKPGVGDIKANANVIKRTLQNFGIVVEMDEVSIGPSVTRYALKPAEGVKLSKIIALQNDLSLALAAHPIRIEAPIPGRSLVGIEIPNSTKTIVGLGTLFAAEEFTRSEKSLLVALGKSVSGGCHFGNLGKMPHLLIAGATGSGKSVSIHGLIASLLYRNGPENLKFILIDPKRVELTLYNKIPHLLTPVITDAKKAILALRWACKEMERRYEMLEAESVRDIDSYHKNVLAPELKKLAGKKNAADEKEIPDLMPYIVVVIDELADIMSTYPRELEATVVRLAQMSRATGIHLILSTQRPSVNVITGLIKANIPARVALQVSSQIDSRTILDGSGAEKLLGAGDMLYLGGEMAKPLRLQSPFISETEVKEIVKYLAVNYRDEIPSEINLTESTGAKTVFDNSLGGEETFDNEDELYEQAREEVIRAGKASTSYLQRKLRIGYARAARLVDMLEERGVIGPGEGARPREVINAPPIVNHIANTVTNNEENRQGLL